MLKNVLKGASLGIGFSGIALMVLRFTGLGSTGINALLYLYVLLGATAFGLQEADIRDRLPLDRVVLVSGGEELRLRKILTGEIYRVRGELEKM